MSVRCPGEVGKPSRAQPRAFSTLDRGLSRLGGREPWIGPSQWGRRGGRGGWDLHSFSVWG